MTARPPHPALHLALATGLALGLGACGADDPKPGPEVAGGNAGIDESVDSDVKVLDVELEYPLDGTYAVGDEASLFLAVSNTGSEDDTLIDVTGPDFAEVRSDAVADGDRLAVPVAGNDTVYIGAEDQPTLTLVDLDRPLTSSQSIPVTFVFDHAGSVTVPAVVAAEGQDPGSDADFTDPGEDPTRAG